LTVPTWPLSLGGFRWLTLALGAGTLGWLWALCAFDPGINFLSRGPAQWMAYPGSLSGKMMPGIELPATFRRTFLIDKPFSPARLSWCAFTQCQISINGQRVAAPGGAGENWKRTSRLEISKYLRQGANRIEARVRDGTGPPALSLKLDTPALSLRSDTNWEVSLAGSVWRPARPAAATLAAGPGNDLHGLETVGGALARSWRALAFFALMSVTGVAAAVYLTRRIKPGIRRPIELAALMIIAAAWVALLVHNSGLVSSIIGFDASEHLSYISYILDTKALPAADEGWEMYQPPFYYAAAAALLGVCGFATGQAGAMILLRQLNLAIGMVQVALVYAALRMLFAGQWKKQIAGAVLAAFLPAQIYLLHYPTNETLCAAMTSAGILLCLRILRQPQSGAWLTAALGATLGVALLTKVSALPAIAVVFAVLGAKLMGQRAPWRGWLETIGLALALTVVIDGWHYARLWVHFGNPLIGNWDAKLGNTWWQQPGFHTWTYYLSFGRALTRPFFSGFHSFWDSLYSTLWGDGFLGGRTDLFSRPPWNYDLMAAGFVLALAPSLVVVTGLACVVVRCWRAPRLEWLLVAGVAAVYCVAILFMTLKLPYYAQAKAIYGLPALLPFCVLFVAGLEFWMARGKTIGNVVLVALGLWLINVYASFWVRADAPATRLSAAAGMYFSGKEDPTGDLLEVLRQDPRNSTAQTLLALLETRAGHPERAARRMEEALRTIPDDASICAQAAMCLARQGRSADALACAQRAVALGPDSSLAPAVWCRLAFDAKQYDEAVTAGRLAVGLTPADAASHFYTGVALIDLHRGEEAIPHLWIALAEQPSWAEAHFYLGTALSSQPGKRAEALAHLTQAARLAPSNDIWRAALEKLQKQDKEK
jgi:tetratricopeptide (TPR) repeat protein